MQRDWRDFKALHSNIAGAREAFENACEILFKKQYPNKYVSQMEVSRGDGGIDIFIGKYSKEPIIVVQCKFFLEKFESSQKQQIKDSFNKAYNNKDYKLSKWILCIPRIFTQKDNEWWFDWIEKQGMQIELINGNELISSMQEYSVYNQIFQMEDSLKLDSINSKLDDLTALSIQNKIIETDFLPPDQSRHITIELEPVDNDYFKIIILEESEENNYLEVKFSNDKPYTRREIVDVVDAFIDENYEDVSSSNIFLVFVLPSNLMVENIDFWKLSDDDRTLGDEYTILLRGQERFRKKGIYARKKKLYINWKNIWDNCQSKYEEKICDISHQVECGQEKLQSRKVENRPFIVLNYTPNEKQLNTLYRSHVTIMMWANNCQEYSKFKALFEIHKNKKFGNIHKELYDFKPNETGLDANIMLLYDDPNKLPHDANAEKFEVPE
jgi:hypothetical protein